MKKLIVLLLTVSLTFSIVACGTKPSDGDSKTPTQSANSERDSQSQSEVESNADSQVTEEPITYNLSPGEVEGAIYSNPSIPFAMSIPGGWEYRTEAELLELNNSSSETLSEAFANAKAGDSFFLQAAYNKITGSSIIISVLCSDGSVTEKMIAEFMTQKEYSAAEQLIAQGHTNVTSAIELIQIGQKEHYAVRTSGMNSLSMTYNDLYLVDLGDYILSFTIGTTDENIRNDLLQNLYFGENAKAEAVNNYKEIVATLGTTTENTYTNESLGIGCTLPNGWTYYDRNTLMTANGLRTNLTEEELITALNAQSVYMDLYAYTAKGDSLNIQVQKLDSTDLGYLNEQTCIVASIPSIETLFPLMGYENMVITEEKFEILGRTHYGLKLNATIRGVSFYEKVACVQIDQYIVTITAANINEDLTEELLNSFYLLEE